MKKICFIASTGGHFDQLMMLKQIMDKYDSFIITEKTSYQAIKDTRKTYYLKQVNRHEKIFIFKMLVNLINTLKIFIKEKPDVVISTGALVTIPMCIIAKIFRKKLIFIESFAKINSPTLTGKLLYKFADQFYVQWKDMLKVYPKAIYKGGIY
ncbi:PssD/Cps14F family polysaccharide biosynthesis glycosyltransferase [Clostridium sp.]|uniref:PssD/Cps14F family polysaccharide biosynthesis glycosyltransferase n=1 Tax=Clostridium sp. TaxID=1506 RepID=UPI0025BDCB68|nr:PssD/Cps14F family polysaccharide biosynthesis glycosyltransferase [Clostridium sp.]